MNRRRVNLSRWFALSILVSCVTNSFGMKVTVDPRNRIESELIATEDLDALRNELARELVPTEIQQSNDEQRELSREPLQRAVQHPVVERLSFNSRQGQNLRLRVAGVVGKAGFKSFGTAPQQAPESQRDDAPTIEAPAAPTAKKRNEGVHKNPVRRPSVLDDLDADELLDSDSSLCDPESLKDVYEQELGDETEELYSQTLADIPVYEKPAQVKQEAVARRSPAIVSQPSTEGLLDKNQRKNDEPKRSKSKGSLADRLKSPRSPRPVSQERTQGAPVITMVKASKKGTVPWSQTDPDRRFKKAYNQYVMECSVAQRDVDLSYPACFHEFCNKIRLLEQPGRNIDTEICEQNEELMNAFFHWAVKILPLADEDKDRTFKEAFNQYVLIAADKGHDRFRVYPDCFSDFCENQQIICNGEYSNRKASGDTTTPRRVIRNEVVEQSSELRKEFLQWLLASNDLSEYLSFK